MNIKSFLKNKISFNHFIAVDLALNLNIRGFVGGIKSKLENSLEAMNGKRLFYIENIKQILIIIGGDFTD